MFIKKISANKKKKMKEDFVLSCLLNKNNLYRHQLCICVLQNSGAQCMIYKNGMSDKDLNF